uniref:Predicted thiol-disulfide isomerase/thioredoxin n=1 Tax=Gamma-proteobacterium EBAC31A08 TaxID=133804 RepID=Q7BKF8_PRB01|nr:predicted thiol-disulfide isomerase/thioredoxin [uncultured marine gamma proteobacterium EBAC31A08]
MIKSLIIILLSNVIAGELNSANLFENSNRVPEANEVFALTTNVEKQAAYITWQIRDGYYMYLDSIELKFKDKVLPFKTLESSKDLYRDEFFGETEILRDEFIISIEINSSLNLSEVLIYYQGCSEAGFCYPMQKNQLL